MREKPKTASFNTSTFVPEEIYFEKDALQYPLGQKIFNSFQAQGREIRFTTAHNRVTGIKGRNSEERFWKAKKILVVGVRKTLTFAGCRPSAHFQLPLATGYPGTCQYCYLHTTLGPNPYLRIYVNLDDILQAAEKHIAGRLPQVTLFEGSATSDPLAAESYSGALKQTVSFFADSEKGRFRFATKQVNIEELLNIKHGENTRVRFSLNAFNITRAFEIGVPPLEKRIEASVLLKNAGFPVGYLIAPVFVFPGWQEEYLNLLQTLSASWSNCVDSKIIKNGEPTFEIIAHRFTRRAKKRIEEIFPSHSLPMDEKKRKFKYGQFGYGKFVYPPHIYDEISSFFKHKISELFPQSKIEYIV